MTTKFRKRLGENTLVEIEDGDLFITQIDDTDNGALSWDVIRLTPKQLLGLLVYLHELSLEVKHEMMSDETPLDGTMADRFGERDSQSISSPDDIGGDPVELKMTKGIAGANVLIRVVKDSQE